MLGENKQSSDRTDQVIDVKRIQEVIQQIQNTKKPTIREQCIKMLYQVQQTDDYTYVELFSRYKLITVLLSISEEQFQQQFNVKKKSDAKLLVELSGQQDIKQSNQLEIFASICKYLEYFNIYFMFSKRKLPFEAVPDDIWDKLLDGLSNKACPIQCDQILALIGSTGTDNTKAITKFAPDSKNQDINLINQNLEQFFAQLSNNDIYNAIIISDIIPTQNFQTMKFRNLAYTNIGAENQILQLAQPQSLVSISLYEVGIQNLGLYENLESIYSVRVKYKREDILQLRKLVYIHSWYDKYVSEGSCFLEDVFVNAKPEHVFIWSEQDNNMVKSCILAQNIQNLRFFEVYQQKLNIQIELNVESEQPENLRVFNVRINKSLEYGDETQFTYGRISGSQESVEKINAQIIHEMKQPK